MSEHDVGIFARADPRSVTGHEARRHQYLPVWHEEELRCFTYDPHDVHPDGRPVGRTGFIHLVRGVKPERERAPDRWDLVDGVLVDHHFVGRARIEHPSLHHDRPVDLSQVRAVGRTEDEGGLTAVVIAEQEVPDGRRSHLGSGPKTGPVRMADTHLAGEGDGVGRIGLHPQSFERGVGAPGTRPGRKCESGSQADQNTEEDERPPTSTRICSCPECRRSYPTWRRHSANGTRGVPARKGGYLTLAGSGGTTVTAATDRCGAATVGYQGAYSRNGARCPLTDEGAEKHRERSSYPGSFSPSSARVTTVTSSLPSP